MACPERYFLPSFINVDATRIYKDKQGQCHIAMKFTGGSKEYSEKMNNEDFMAFKNGDLTKEEVIAKYHKPLIEEMMKKYIPQINLSLINHQLIKTKSRDNFIKNVMKAILLVLLSVSCIEHIDLYHVLPIRYGQARHHDKQGRYFST